MTMEELKNKSNQEYKPKNCMVLVLTKNIKFKRGVFIKKNQK